MNYQHWRYGLAADATPASDSISLQIFGGAVCAGLPHEDQAVTTRRIATPATDAIPSFDNVFASALTSALFDQSVVVICMTEELLTDWRQRLQERARPVEGLTLLDGRCGWSADWRAFFHTRSYDITVLHGIHRALQDHDLPLSYARRLAYAVPRGLIVLA